MHAPITLRPWTLVAAQPGVMAALKELKETAERIGLVWGGMDGEDVIVYFESYKCRLPGLKTAARWLNVWAGWEAKGDRLWYDWGLKVYRQLAEEGRDGE